METLRQSMHAAVDQAPPTSIDLDHLIAHELRARRLRRTGWAVAGAAGTMLAVTTGATLLLTGLPDAPAQTAGSPTGPCASARPTPSTSDDASYEEIPRGDAPEPTEPEAEAVLRLSAAVTDALATHLPGRTATDHQHPGCHWVQVEPNVYPARYYAWADVTGGAAAAGASITVMISDKDLPGLDVYPHHQTLPDGTLVGHFGRPGQVGARFPDGTTVTVLLPGPDGSRVATLDELIALATDPRLTLYP